MEKAILLCRISDAKQNDGFSLEAQEKHGEAYCKERGLDLVEKFIFTETASKNSNRHKFKKVLAFLNSHALKNKGCIHLVVEKPDRLSRNFSSKEQIQILVMSGHLKVHYHRDKRIFDQNCSPADIFNDDIQTAVSKYQALNISRESKKGMNEKASQGWFPSRAPYGYINKREPSLSGGNRGRGISTIIVDPDAKMVKMVQKIYELRATRNLSFKEILKYIREENMIPSGKTLSKTGIEGILKNKFYGGTFIWQGEEYKGNHELIIPRKHFKAVHDVDKRTYSRKPSGLLSGFLTCSTPRCGCHILYDPKVKILKSSGEKRTYHYYHCSDGRGIHKDQGQRQINISQRKLLDKFSKPVSEISIGEELAKAVSKALKKAHDKTILAHKRNMEGYRVVIKQTEAEEDKAYELLSLEIIDQPTYRRQIKAIRIKKRQYENLLEEGQVSISTKFYETSDTILELAKSAELFWKEGTDEEKLKFLKKILSNQVLNSTGENVDDLTIEYDLIGPLKELAKIKKATPKSGFLNENKKWCPVADSNHGHRDFQSLALPTELTGQIWKSVHKI